MSEKPNRQLLPAIPSLIPLHHSSEEPAARSNTTQEDLSRTATVPAVVSDPAPECSISLPSKPPSYIAALQDDFEQLCINPLDPTDEFACHFGPLHLRKPFQAQRGSKTLPVCPNRKIRCTFQKKWPFFAALKRVTRGGLEGGCPPLHAGMKGGRCPLRSRAQACSCTVPPPLGRKGEEADMPHQR